MLGKRPRPLQRSTSKMHLLSNDSVFSSITDNNLYHETYEGSKHVVRAPRQVIGFNAVNEVPDGIQSILPGIGIQSSETKSARSLRSGLESLFSNLSACEQKSREGTLMEISNFKNAQDDVAKHPTGTTPKALAIGQQQQRYVKQSEPICISLTSGNQRRPRRWHWDEHDRFKQFDDYIFWGLRSHTPRKEVEMETRQSIFSTASPASSCGELDSSLCPDADFLSSCYLCKRQLGLGKDIYIYRGDRAFCSVECRYQHIVFDECKVRCSASAPASHFKGRPRLFATSPAAGA